MQPTDVTARLRDLAGEHLEAVDRSRLEQARNSVAGAVAPAEIPILLTDAVVADVPALVVVTSGRVLVAAETGELLLPDLFLEGIQAVRVSVSHGVASLRLMTVLGEIDLENVGDPTWAEQLRDAIDGARPRSMITTDTTPAGQQVPTRFDADVAFVCSACSAEYTAQFRGSSCLDCGGQLQHTTGGALLPESATESFLEPDDYDEDEDDDEFLEPFATENPFLRKAFGHDLYGLAPARAVALLREVSPDPEERLLTALRTKHGRYKRGYLVATTALLRWIQVFPYREDDFWSYDYSLDIDGGPFQGGVVRTAGGDQFQIRWGVARQFGEFHRLVQQAVAWDNTNAQLVPQVQAPAATSGPALSEELERLARLYEQGLLDADEFRAAKARLLS